MLDHPLPLPSWFHTHMCHAAAVLSCSARREEEAPLLATANEAKLKVRRQGQLACICTPVVSGSVLKAAAVQLHGNHAHLSLAVHSTLPPTQPSHPSPPFLPAPHSPRPQEDEELFHSEASAFKAAHRAAWERDLQVRSLLSG